MTEACLITTAFSSGVAIALAHSAISLEVGVSLGDHGPFIRSIFLALYPVGVAFMGLGAIVERRLSGKITPSTLAGVSLRAAGVAILLFLVIVLRANSLTTSPRDLVFAGAMHLTLLAAWFLCMGTTVTSLLRAAKRHTSSRCVGKTWAIHLAGLIAGYAATDLLVHAVGPHAILLAIGLSLLAAPRGSPLVIAAILAAAPALSLDGRIEVFRDLTRLTKNTATPLPDPLEPSRSLYSAAPNLEILYRGWSRFGQVHITRTKDGTIYGSYNFVSQWSTAPSVPNWRSILYGGIRPSQRVLILAAGGGSGVSELPFPAHKDVTVVELNETVVRFLKDDRPDLNNGAFRRTSPLAADARFVIDTARELFDVILVETGRFHPAQMWAPAGSPQSLYTREAIHRYLAQIRPGGLILFVFNDTSSGHNHWNEYFPMQVIRTLSETETPFRVIAANDDESQHLAIAASNDRAVLEDLSARTRSASSDGLRPIRWRPRSDGHPSHRERLTDDRPFASWHRLESAHRAILLLAAAVLAGTTVIAALWTSRPSAPSRSTLSFFFLIGAAQVMMQIGTVYAYRSFYGDTMTTAIRLTIYFLAYGALGSIASNRFLNAGRNRLAVAILILMALHALGLALIPFTAASPFLREAFACAMLVPGGLFMGALFPAAILSISGTEINRSLLADSLGAVAGYAFVYLVMLPWGIRAFLCTAFAFYGASLAVLPAARANQ